MESQKQERSVKEMKIVTKIIAFASIFSFILSYSSLISSLQQRLHLLAMYSNLVDKKYMFLLCNGIVGFILGSFHGNSDSLSHGKAINIVEQTKEVGIKDLKETKVNKVVALLEESNVSKEEEGRVVLSREEEEEVALVVKEDEGILVQDLSITRLDDHDDDDAINDSLLSSEDLNKKCEDFIRKMKAEIRYGKRSI
ncbi:unnamed protein product [Arabidopsis thaliana]|uniref:Transmembrane protein n=2 Tax=Arabidopsis thaliana TaxID=3702 RepID=A0A654ETG5_ARATH|nr:uncharacterized protein AT2G04515 [Arabidopsis thaliana]AAV63866.1 hypothetical protein At2g04515 [Arabidopsis thaliana]AEC05841.1 transmembrane protein [Arabidopsis thaliana]CAA0357444.1 unnamed protein product [Arabidopsis thaliana]VYS52030.1 unnamed protein product [Arabidopsis thaliana]|eukprot:NP_671777.1 transmembrane protein [Arabidopsis thaliana]